MPRVTPAARRAPVRGEGEEIHFFLPGPAYVLEAVRRAQVDAVVGHRSRAFRDLYVSCTERLQPIFRTAGAVMTATGSATLVMESAVASTVGTDVLNLVNGAFSERWHAISRALGKRADRVAVPWGEAVDPDLVRTALRRKRYEAVTVVHSETSTGVLSPLQEIARVVREESDALVLVDAVSSLGGAPVETDAWGLDVVLTASQKALAVPPGLALFTLSERAARRAEGIAPRGYYTDLLRYRAKHREGGPITTPAVSVFYALDRQLDRILTEGIERRWERHRGLVHRLSRWVEQRPVRFASAALRRSPTISCLRGPDGITPAELVDALVKRGFQVANGYGELAASTFRIGHLGEVVSADLERLLAALDEVLAELGALSPAPSA